MAKIGFIGLSAVRALEMVANHEVGQDTVRKTDKAAALRRVATETNDGA